MHNHCVLRPSPSYVLWVLISGYTACLWTYGDWPIHKWYRPAAIWPVILRMIPFLVISLPIIGYTRLVPFAGGYYGLAELRFGNAVGKFTGLINAVYGFF